MSGAPKRDTHAQAFIDAALRDGKATPAASVPGRQPELESYQRRLLRETGNQGKLSDY
jgi:hypothetical protein